jgi:hypothetical protein
MRLAWSLLFLPAVAWGAPSLRHFEKLKASLESQYPKAKVEKLEQPGPAQVTIVGAKLHHAPPGGGVRCVLVDAGDVSYGKHGEKTFADFVRGRGWLTNPPPIDDFLRLLNAAQYDGVVMLEAVSPLRKTPAGLEVRFDHLIPGPGHPKPTTWELVIPAGTGDLLLRRVK